MNKKTYSDWKLESDRLQQQQDDNLDKLYGFIAVIMIVTALVSVFIIINV